MVKAGDGLHVYIETILLNIVLSSLQHISVAVLLNRESKNHFEM